LNTRDRGPSVSVIVDATLAVQGYRKRVRHLRAQRQAYSPELLHEFVARAHVLLRHDPAEAAQCARLGEQVAKTLADEEGRPDSLRALAHAIILGGRFPSGLEALKAAGAVMREHGDHTRLNELGLLRLQPNRELAYYDELCAIGRPSILIPFPFAADDHQAKNARALEEQGASICIRESELEVETLGQLVGGLLDDPARRQAMASAARDHGRPDAAAAIVDDIMGWLGGTQPLGEAVAAPEGESPPGALYSGLAMPPMLRLGCAESALRPATHRTRRPVVVDGAVWE